MGKSIKILSIFIHIILSLFLILFFSCQQPAKKLSDSDKTYAIGDKGPSGVGIVFYVTNGGLHGLEAAPTDQIGSGSTWSTITTTYANGISALPIGIGTGSANTDAIIAQNSGAASAAKLCRDYTGGGRTDWFLPSQDELNQLYLQRTKIGGFATSPSYWSSSEGAADKAWKQAFDTNGYQYSVPKSDGNLTRAIRSF